MRRSCPATCAFALLALTCCAPDREAGRKGLPITAAERALAQAAWDMDIVDSAPVDACGVGGTGLDLGPWLDEREQRATLATLVTSNDATRLVSLATTLQRERQVLLLSALLDHPDLEVRRAAVQGLKNLRDRRAVIGLLAAAKHNAFELGEGPQPASQPAALDEARRAAQLGYRKELANALMHITKVKPYEGPAQRKGGPAKIWAFDFGRLDLWLENEVLRARRWSE